MLVLDSSWLRHPLQNSKSKPTSCRFSTIWEAARFRSNRIADRGSCYCRYMDKRLLLQLNGNRRVTGVLRGYDPFMNIVLDDAVEEVSATEKNHIGMVVSISRSSIDRLLFLHGIMHILGYPWQQHLHHGST